jgi:hypothetical protein
MCACPHSDMKLNRQFGSSSDIMALMWYLSGVFNKRKLMEFVPPVPEKVYPLTDPDTLATVQVFLVAFIEFNLKQQNGNAVNVARAFRDHVSETVSKLNP